MNIRKFASIVLALTLVLSFSAVAFANEPTDEITDYVITANINQDATVRLDYHIDWLVLESDELGPVSWVNVGIPTTRCSDYSSDSENVESIEPDGASMNIYFNREYYEGETISFDFTVTCDYMYEMNGVNTGETIYYFSPGWFDGIAIDSMTIRWNADKAVSWSGGAHEKDGYLEWTDSLDPGEIYDVNISYPNDAFTFRDTSSSATQSSSSSSSDLLWTISGILIPLVFVGVFVLIIVFAIKAIKKSYKNNSGFANGQTETKVTRTKVIYYDTCPGCGAPREEGKEVCQYCGRDLIKSEEVIKEEDLSAADKEAMRYSDNGIYHYGPDPNTFVRVNRVHVPVVNPAVMGIAMHNAASHSSSRSSSSCAHSSCACACACACAGGGRAGCTTKDFYSAKLKLKQIRENK